LGTGFDNLTILWIARSCVVDLDGINSFSNLKELYLAYNEIVNIEQIARLEYLEILDLESNQISDLEQIEHLALCTQLKCLTLEGNPLCFSNIIDDNDDDQLKQVKARDYIISLIPQIEILDDVEIVKRTGIVVPAFRPNTSYGKRPASPSTLLLGAERPGSSSARPHYSRGDNNFSTLTIGITILILGFEKPLAGNIISALRSRRNQKPDILSFENTEKSMIPCVPEIESKKKFQRKRISMINPHETEKSTSDIGNVFPRVEIGT
jgi:hypothetical protein